MYGEMAKHSDAAETVRCDVRYDIVVFGFVTKATDNVLGRPNSSEKAHTQQQ